MKKLTLLTIVLTIGLAAVAQSKLTPAKPGVTYGKAITADKAISTVALSAALAADSVYTGKISGKVVEVCKVKGCFIKLAQANGKTTMVNFTNYAFFVPQNIIGQKVVVAGTAKVKETSVAQLQHLAKDAGKAEAEIAMIKEPKKDIGIMADGILVTR